MATPPETRDAARLCRLAAGLVLALALVACAPRPPPDGALIEPPASLSFPYPVPPGVDFPDYRRVAEADADIYVRVRVESDERDCCTNGRDDVAGSNVVGYASGIIVDPRGYVVTAAHIALSTKFHADVITLDGHRFFGRVVAVDRQRELAIIKINPFPGMAVARFADSDRLERGEAALAIGTPGHHPGVVTVGRVIQPHLMRRIAYNDFGYDHAIELEMEVDPGHSGGPILDADGRLIGMVASFLLGPSGSKAHSRPLVALAVPSNDIRAFLHERVGE